MLKINDKAHIQRTRFLSEISYDNTTESGSRFDNSKNRLRIVGKAESPREKEVGKSADDERKSGE